MIQFTQPWALLLLGLLAPFWLLSVHSLAGLGEGRRRVALLLRCVVVLALVFALAGLQWVQRVRGTSVVYVVDRSDSIPDADRDQTLAFINQAAETMRPDDTAGVVVTARTALLERAPEPAAELASVDSQPDSHFTDLAAGLRLAAATVKPDARRRIVLLSDGNENLGDAVGEARLTAALGIPIDVVPLLRHQRGEVVAERLLVPGEVRRGDTLEARLVVESDTTTEAVATLLRDNVVAAEIRTRLNPGKSVVAFPPVTLEGDGFHDFSAVLEPLVDQDRRNNRALGFSFVRGRRRVLYVEGDRGQDVYLATALSRSGLEVKAVPPSGLPGSLADLASYDCLILSNVSALDLADAQMVMVRAAVRDLGIGLVMIGGDESFGVGGYYRTPIEEALPVDMDIQKLRHLPNVGVAIVIDQSGSMAMTEGGVEKIELANEAAIALVSLLGPRDEIQVIATDSVAKPVFSGGMVKVERKQPLIDEIARIRAGGGGIYCYNGLKKAADLIRPSDTKLKHIILFADAADSEQQENCRELVTKLASEKITTSVVALGRNTDPDVKFLEDIAKLGKGRYYITHRASNLPRIFTREAILASRSQLVEKQFTPLLLTDIEPLAGIDALPPLLGYVATTAKPAAAVGLVADPKFKDPVLATWQYGLGRSAAFTSDCKAHWGVHWLDWGGYEKFWSQVVRWTIRRVRRGQFETQVLTRFHATSDEVAAYRLKRGEARVVVDAVDDDGNFINGLELHGSAIAPDGSAVDLNLSQVAPGRYEAAFAAEQVGVYLVNVAGGEGDAAGSQTVGFALAYPPEYGDVTSNETLLARVAQLSDGVRLEQPAQVFEPRGEPARAPSDLWPWLLLTALILFPLDVAIRRLILDPRRLRNWLRRRRPAVVVDEPLRGTQHLRERARDWRLQRPAPPARPTPPEVAAAPLTGEVREPEPEAPPEPDAPGTGLGSIAKQARERRQREVSRAAEPAPPVTPSPPRAPSPTPRTEPAGKRDVTETLSRLKRARERLRERRDEPDDEA